ncbi:MAG: ATP-binding protein [Coriobacteriia bacterium]|nr:ATP-binding protein [Coriobacteriia bacterium]
MNEESREEAAMLWGDVVQLACESGDPEMAQWLERLLPVSFDGTTLVCATKLKWTERRVMTNYRAAIEASIHEITMEPASLSVVVDPSLFADSPSSPESSAASVTPTPAPVPAQPSPVPSAQPVTAAPTPAAVESPAETPSLSPAALAGAQAAVSRTTHPLVGLRAKIPTAVSASLEAARPSIQTAQTSAEPPVAAQLSSVPPATPTQVEPPAVPAETPAFAAESRSSAPDDQAVQYAEPDEPEPTPVPVAPPSSEVSAQVAAADRPSPAPAEPLSNLTFETFVVGEANRMAFDAARTIAEEEVVPYNPLFLYSKPGMGKTHLLHAIRNYIQMYRPGINVSYARAEDLLDTYTSDLKEGKRGAEILRDYRQADVLLVDDVQFFQKKDATQVTFFDIFNQLTMQGKSVVLTADVPPDYLQLDERLKQRFGMGLIIDISAPNFELKRAILHSYSQTYCQSSKRFHGVSLSEDALSYMAELAPNSIRETLGFLTRVLAEQAVTPQQPLTHERIKAVRDKLFKAGRRVDIAMIIDVVCEELGVPSADIKGKGRTKPVSEARQITMWLARQMTDESYQAIGSPFGRDHSTVYASISKIDLLSQEDPVFLARLEALKRKIEGRTA